MASVRLAEVVKLFFGEGDVVQWIAKFKLVAELREVKNLDKKILPLFSEGKALTVHTQFDGSARADFEAIKKKLVDVFSLSAFHAYEQLTRRVWRDEPVGVYVSDLRRLAKLAGVETDDLIRRAFVVGLPSEVYRELRVYENIDVLPVSDIVSRARALLAKQVDEDFVAVSKRMT